MNGYMKLAPLTLLGSLFLSAQIFAKERINFPSVDGLQMTADTYFSDNKASPLIVLFHQAGWGRGEYLEIAPKLNSLGFNVLAIDLRSGKKLMV